MLHGCMRLGYMGILSHKHGCNGLRRHMLKLLNNDKIVPISTMIYIGLLLVDHLKVMWTKVNWKRLVALNKTLCQLLMKTREVKE